MSGGRERKRKRRRRWKREKSRKRKRKRMKTNYRKLLGGLKGNSDLR